LNISGIFGSIKIKLPPGIPARFYGSSIIGTLKFLEEKRDGLLISLSSSTADYDSAEKKLDIKTSLIFGDITVQ
jgi:predicted membrane protein